MVTFSNRPMPLTFAENTTFIDKLSSFLGQYDLRVYLSEKSYIDVGRGSFRAAMCVEFVTEEQVGCIGKVGQFCNFAAPCHLFGGGEHWNENPVNVIFNNVPPLAASSRLHADLCPKPLNPFNIGNGVVVSGYAKVISGANIGDGSVLGAAALAVGDIEPFSIVGGSPAKLIKKRFDIATEEAIKKVRWWDFDLVYLSNNMSRLQSLAKDINADHVYKKQSPALVMRLRRMGANYSADITGFLKDGEERSLNEATPRVRDYLTHIGGAGPFHWLADMWND